LADFPSVPFVNEAGVSTAHEMMERGRLDDLFPGKAHDDGTRLIGVQSSLQTDQCPVHARPVKQLNLTRKFRATADRSHGRPGHAAC
jgi:hypothetical protein